LDASVHVYLFLSLSLFFFRSAFFLCFYLDTYDTGVAESRRGAATDTRRFRVIAERARAHTLVILGAPMSDEIKSTTRTRLPSAGDSERSFSEWSNVGGGALIRRSRTPVGRSRRDRPLRC